jgi:hypothetical protein
MGQYKFSNCTPKPQENPSFSEQGKITELTMEGVLSTHILAISKHLEQLVHIINACGLVKRQCYLQHVHQRKVSIHVYKD